MHRRSRFHDLSRLPHSFLFTSLDSKASAWDAGVDEFARKGLSHRPSGVLIRFSVVVASQAVTPEYAFADRLHSRGQTDSRDVGKGLLTKIHKAGQ